MHILTSYFICPAENDYISQRANIFSKLLFINVTKLVLKVTLGHVFKQVRKGVSIAPPNPASLTSKKANFCRITELEKFEIKLNKQ